MTIDHPTLKQLIQDIFSAAGSHHHEAERIAHYLALANLVGHDSHGAIQVPRYIERVRANRLVPNQTVEIVSENEVLAVLDGRLGFGQVIGEEAMRIALDKCAKFGLSLVTLRNSGHLGRIGDWAEMAAGEGKVSLHFVNTSGGGILVAPHGGTERRLSANPIAAGVPVPGGPPIILDISTCTIAEGKIRVAANKGANVPEGCILDGQGRPTTDPQAFYASPPGAILPFGGHKGFALGVIVDVLAGAISGGSCSRPETKVASNNMLAIVIDPARLRARPEFDQDLADFTAWVKSAATVAPDGQILMPGEPEHRTKVKRLREGIPLDATTWNQLQEVARSLNIPGH
jgi:hydroxycarboxylate dehydrogenase B